MRSKKKGVRIKCGGRDTGGGIGLGRAIWASLRSSVYAVHLSCYGFGLLWEAEMDTLQNLPAWFEYSEEQAAVWRLCRLIKPCTVIAVEQMVGGGPQTAERTRKCD